MDKVAPWQEHPNYDDVIEEVLHNSFDEDLMSVALLKTKTESQAEALYVILKLKQSSY